MRGYRLAMVVLALAGCGAPDVSAGSGVDQPWAWEMPQCVGYRAEDYHSPEHRVAVEVREEPGVLVQVETYQPGWGPRAMAEIRAVIEACGSYEYGERGDPDAFLAQHLVVETGFAGDESLLVEGIRLQPPASETRYAAVVLRGEVVTTVRTADPAEAKCHAGATCPAGQT
jgi:hypothetical protein